MARQAIWIHGNDVQPRSFGGRFGPGWGERIERCGWTPNRHWRDVSVSWRPVAQVLCLGSNSLLAERQRQRGPIEVGDDRLSIPSLGGVKATLVENQNRWDLANQPEVNFGICIEFSVACPTEGLITFHSVGADFMV